MHQKPMLFMNSLHVYPSLSLIECILSHASPVLQPKIYCRRLPQAQRPGTPSIIHIQKDEIQSEHGQAMSGTQICTQVHDRKRCQETIASRVRP